ncbi:MAG: hypothetical protein H0X45_06490 [Planctomycetes bacterium]|nr:hypothetical protein [Planctomycetota bacterium]
MTQAPAAAFLAAIGPGTPMPLGPTVRAQALDIPAVEARVAEFVAATPGAVRATDHLRAAALLWHDRLDASHAVSQDLDDADAAWLHGIMHRREPDYGNAKYWFARVGRHPAYAQLAAAAGLATWDADAFIDRVARAEAGAEPIAPLVDLQAREFSILIAHLMR